MSDIFSPEALGAQLEKLRELPADEAQVGIVAKDGDVGIEGRVNVDVGKPGGWFVAGEGNWMRRGGRYVAGLVGWKRGAK